MKLHLRAKEDAHQRCRNDMLWQTVLCTSTNDRKGSVDIQRGVLHFFLKQHEMLLNVIRNSLM